MSDLPELETLVDAFPQYPRLELASRLLCASSPDVLFNELVLEVSSTNTAAARPEPARVFPPGVAALAQLFPAAHKDSLAAALQQNNGCVDKTVEALLEQQPVQELARVCGLPETELVPYAARHNDDVLRALADVVAHYKKRKRVRTSRVQTHARAAGGYTAAYVLLDAGRELALLQECVWAEPALQGINYDFLVRLLVFFQGDVGRVLDVARLYIEAGRQAVTYDTRLGLTPTDAPAPPAPEVPAATVLRLALPGLVSPAPGASNARGAAAAGPKPGKPGVLRETAPFGVGAKITPANTARLSLHVRAGRVAHDSCALPPGGRGLWPRRLDLHGYTVAEATAAATSAVSAWWAEEIQQRTVEGRMDKYGARAEFVEPLQLITGRGIHSAGGAPRIRLSVIRLLRTDGFLMDEGLGSVAVVGKRPRR